MQRLRLSLLTSALALLNACSAPPPAERYAFITTLGRDTIAVERVEKSHARMVTDGVDRFPFVRIRHSEFELAKDGKIRHMLMKIRTPNGRTPAERGRTVTADFAGNEVKIRVADSAQVRDTTFRTGGVLAVPHVSMMYSVIEHEIATALREGGAEHIAAGDSVHFRQFYPDRDVGPSFTLHHGYVHPMAHDTVELRHDWLAGTAVVTVDSTGRMQTYDGSRTTYKVLVRRTADTPDVDAIATRMTAAEARDGLRQLSVRDTVHASVGLAQFTIDYGRPLARGRRLIGDVIPYDYIWRTGANAATQFTTSRNIRLGTLDVPAGKYTLWTVPRADRVELAVNQQTGQWGTDYARSRDLGRTILKTESGRANVEAFTLSLAPTDASHATLVLEWGDFRWTAPIVVK